MNILSLIILAGIAIGIPLIISLMFRRVVDTNEVHIVQSGRQTISYGRVTNAEEQTHGNVYYEWPSFLPKIGVKVTNLPLSIFSIELKDYAAFDIGRVPFVVTIQAFFRISDAAIAAERISSFEDLLENLEGVLKSAARAMLATSEIEQILQGRGEFGIKFTAEVKENLSGWGIEPVKSIELMEMKDAADSKVISNIMEKKKSLIEKESRIEVAQNNRDAQIVEIDAKRETDLQDQIARQTVGQRTAEANREIGIADEKAAQLIKEEQKTTKEKEMAVKEVEDVRTAEIVKSVQVVQAAQDKETTIIKAEGNLEETKRIAEGIEVKGKADAEAEKLKLLAPVQAQLELAEGIAAKPEYINYLLGLEKYKVLNSVGTAQASALEAADLKVIANSGSVTEGATNLMGLLNSGGGTQLLSMLEAFSQSDIGASILSKVVPPKTTRSDDFNKGGNNAE